MSRINIYPIFLLIIFSAIIALQIKGTKENIAPNGKPLGTDYITFWAAAKMASEGIAQEAYDPEKIVEFEKQAAPVESIWYWFYPPSFLLIISNIATDEYLESLAYFTLAGIIIYSLAIFLITEKEYRLALIASPALYITLLHGQNSAMTAGIVGMALWIIERNPITAGILLGIISFKPQLAVPLLLILFANKKWLTLAAMSIMSATLAVWSLKIYGAGSWLAWLESIKIATRINESGMLPWQNMPSAFSFVKSLGGSNFIAYTTQATLATTCAAYTYINFKAPKSIRNRNAAWIVCCLTFSPHIFNYDMTWVAIAIGFAISGTKNKDKFKPLLITLLMYPLAGPLIHNALGFSIEWAIPCILLITLKHIDNA